MLRRLRAALTYANVMATFAVFVALSGTAWAAATITGRDVKDGSLSGRDVKQGTIQSGDIKDGTLRRQDFLPGVLSSGLTTPLSPAEGPAGERGAAGPTGPPGADGAPGKNGVAGKDGIDGKDGINGSDGANGAPGLAGKDGTNGTNGTNGAPGTAVAYGTLQGNTVFDAKGVTNANVTYPQAGVYCLKNLNFNFKSVVATPFLSVGSTIPSFEGDKMANVIYDPNGGLNVAPCGANMDVIITLYDVGAGAFAPGSVVVWFEN
jgi:hypothetical protein